MEVSTNKDVLDLLLDIDSHFIVDLQWLVMDMTHTQDSVQQMHDKSKVSCIWQFKENGVVIAEKKNLVTSYGLTNIASAWGGTNVIPQYLVIDNSKTTLYSNYAVGVSSFQTLEQIHQSGDTQLVLSPGLSNQETVTFSSVSGSGPYTYSLSGTTSNAHNADEYVIRQVKASDTMTNVLGEIQYDSVGNPGNRLQSIGGYSNGVGNWTMQFYFPGTTGRLLFVTLALSDNASIGQGNLHNYVVFGLDHTQSLNELELDIILTLTN